MATPRTFSLSKATNELTGCLIRHILPLRPPKGDVVLVSGIGNASPGGCSARKMAARRFRCYQATEPRGYYRAMRTSLVEDPHHPGRVYAGIGGSSGGVYVSTNAGQTWLPINSGIAPSDLQSIAWIRLALRPGQNGTASDLYAAIITGTVHRRFV